MSFRVKVDLDIVKKARIVDDVSRNACEILETIWTPKKGYNYDSLLL